MTVAVCARNDAAEAERVTATLPASAEPPDAIAAMSDQQAPRRPGRAPRRPRRRGGDRLGRRGGGREHLGLPTVEITTAMSEDESTERVRRAFGL